MRILTSDAVREFVHVRLAKQDCAGSRNFSGNVAVGPGHETGENLRTGRGANPARPEIVLERNRNPMERAAQMAPANFALSRLCLAARAFGNNGKESAERGIPAVDPCKGCLHQVDRGDFPAPQQPRRLLD